jgi:hypothetical protein
MIINPKKILVCYNTAAGISAQARADSQEAAEYYATMRNLDPVHVQGFDFGSVDTIAAPTGRDAFRAGALAAIDAYITANAIEGVLLSINCPSGYGTGAAETYPNKALCRVVGDSTRILAGAATQGPLCGLPNYATETYGPGEDATKEPWYRVRLRVANNATPPFCYDIRNAANNTIWGAPHYKQTPCGRLGYHSGFSDSLSIAKRCVDDAVWFEQNGNPANEPFLFGFSTRTTDGFLGQGHIWDAYRQLHAHVGAVHTYDGNWNNTASRKYAANDWSWEQPEITIPDQATWLMGGGPNIELWGWLGTGFENNGSAYLSSVTFKRGAFMFESTSAKVSHHSLPNGACACIIPYTEPTTAGLPEIGGLVYFMLRGFSLEEATIATMIYSGNSEMAEVWGDPYYSPLNKIRYSKTGGISVGGNGV